MDIHKIYLGKKGGKYEELKKSHIDFQIKGIKLV